MRWRVAVAAGLVLGLVPSVLGGRVDLPGWATPWSRTTTNGTSTLTAGGLVTYTATVQAEAGVALYYRMNEASGSIAPTKGYAYAGPNGSAATYNQTGATTDSDKAIAFTGTQSFDFGNQLWWNGTAAYTIELFFKPTGTLANGVRRLTAKLDTSGSTTGWELGYYGADAGANAGKPYCARSVSGATATAVGTSAMTSGTWYHLVCTYDGSTLRTYVNGSVTNTASSAGSMGTTGSNGAIGSLQATSSYAIGVIDEVAYYNAALSAASVSAHYAAR